VTDIGKKIGSRAQIWRFSRARAGPRYQDSIFFGSGSKKCWYAGL